MIPPRFYALTLLYFLRPPFLFALGANLESLGTKELNGKEYHVVKVTYNPGMGDTPDDDYVACINNDTKQIEGLYYIATYPPLL